MAYFVFHIKIICSSTCIYGVYISQIDQSFDIPELVVPILISLRVDAMKEDTEQRIG